MGFNSAFKGLKELISSYTWKESHHNLKKERTEGKMLAWVH